MQTFKYRFFAKLIYRYGNIPATLLLLIQLYISITVIPRDWVFIFPVLLSLGMLYFLNKVYIKMYKTFPHIIEADNTKMICSDFLIRDRKIEIKMTDIDEITGGMFSGNILRPVYLKSRSTGIVIGLSPHIKNYKLLLKLILSNIRNELYNELLMRIQELNSERKETTVKK